MNPTTPTRERIKSAAVELFAMWGYGATSMRDIAVRVGITKASLYHFFESKESLLREITITGQQALIDMTEEWLSQVERPEDRLAVLVSGLTAVQGVMPTISRVSDREIRSFEPGSAAYAEVIAARDAYEALWKSAIKQGIEEGVFTVSEPALTRLALMSMCGGLSQWYRADGPVALDGICHNFVDTALRAVRASRDGAAISVEQVRVVEPSAVIRTSWEPEASSSD